MPRRINVLLYVHMHVRTNINVYVLLKYMCAHMYGSMHPPAVPILNTKVACVCVCVCVCMCVCVCVCNDRPRETFERLLR